MLLGSGKAGVHGALEMLAGKVPIGREGNVSTRCGNTLLTPILQREG